MQLLIQRRFHLLCRLFGYPDFHIGLIDDVIFYGFRDRIFYRHLASFLFNSENLSPIQHLIADLRSRIGICDCRDRKLHRFCHILMHFQSDRPVHIFFTFYQFKRQNQLQIFLFFSEQIIFLPIAQTEPLTDRPDVRLIVPAGNSLIRCQQNHLGLRPMKFKAGQMFLIVLIRKHPACHSDAAKQRSKQKQFFLPPGFSLLFPENRFQIRKHFRKRRIAILRPDTQAFFQNSLQSAIDPDPRPGRHLQLLADHPLHCMIRLPAGDPTVQNGTKPVHIGPRPLPFSIIFLRWRIAILQLDHAACIISICSGRAEIQQLYRLFSLQKPDIIRADIQMQHAIFMHLFHRPHQRQQQIEQFRCIHLPTLLKPLPQRTSIEKLHDNVRSPMRLKIVQHLHNPRLARKVRQPPRLLQQLFLCHVKRCLLSLRDYDIPSGFPSHIAAVKKLFHRHLAADFFIKRLIDDPKPTRRDLAQNSIPSIQNCMFR